MKFTETFSKTMLLPIQHAANGMALMDANGNFEYLNSALCIELNQKEELLLHANIDFYLNTQSKSSTCKPISAVLQDMEKDEIESFEIVALDKQDKEWVVHISAIGDLNPFDLYLLSLFPVPLSSEKGTLEAILPEILHTTTDFVGLADLNMKIMFLNKACRVSLGYGIDEDLSSKDALDLVPERFRDLYEKEAIPKAIEHGRWEGNSYWRAKDGTEVPVSQVVMVHRDPHGNPLYFSNIARNISLEISQQQELEAEEAKYRSLVERITDAFVSLDNDGRFEYINPTAKQLLGGDADKFIGQKAWELFEYAKQFEIYSVYQKAVETQQNQRHFEYFANRDRWIEFTLYPSENGLSFYFKNVTALKKAEEQLIQANKQLGMLEKFVNLSSDAFQVSDLEGKFVYLNKKAEDRLGISQQELDDYSVQDFEQIFETPEDWENHIASLRANGEMTVQGRNTNQKTSEIVPVEVKVNLEEVEGEEFVIAILRDISDRIEQDRLIAEHSALLEYQNEQLEDFCNMVSHNLRAPLANMSMLVDLIEKSKDLDQKEMLAAQFKPVIIQLNTMFNELMESIQVRRQDEITHDKIDLQEYIDKSLNSFSANLASSDVAISINLERADSVTFPPQYMNNLLHNLLSNCFKYADPKRPLEISISTKKNGKSVILSIEDNGLGMDLEKYGDQLFKLNRVFHKHPDAKGFGLYITRAQIESVGGRIWATSKVDSGSTFYVEFKHMPA